MKHRFEGFLLINKESGCTSFSLVHLLRKLTSIKKVGHTGTLDPLARGLMILLIGKSYTQRASFFSKMGKIYEAEITLGTTTDTFDAEGKVLSSSSLIPTLSQIEKALEQFQGTITQKVPAFSAKKKRGKKLYEYARKQLVVPDVFQEVSLQIQLLSYAYPKLCLRINCSTGSYIRSIAHDLGQLLESGAFLSSLYRTHIGLYSVKQAISQKSLSCALIEQYKQTLAPLTEKVAL